MSSLALPSPAQRPAQPSSSSCCVPVFHKRRPMPPRLLLLVLLVLLPKTATAAPFAQLASPTYSGPVVAALYLVM